MCYIQLTHTTRWFCDSVPKTFNTNYSNFQQNQLHLKNDYIKLIIQIAPKVLILQHYHLRCKSFQLFQWSRRFEEGWIWVRFHCTLTCNIMARQMQTLICFWGKFLLFVPFCIDTVLNYWQYIRACQDASCKGRQPTMTLRQHDVYVALH